MANEDVSNLLIEELHEGDIDDIIEMRRKSTKDFPNEWLDVPTPERLTEALREYPKRNIRHLVAKIGGKVIGEIVFNESHPPDAWVDFLLVHPSHRGKGAGTQLLKEAISQLSRKGFCIAGVGTWRENQRAIDVYKKAGFKVLAPEAALLVDFFGIPLITGFFVGHPRLEEAELNEDTAIDAFRCSSVSWKDTETSDSLTLYFRKIGRYSNAYFKNRSALIALESNVKGRELRCRLTSENWSPSIGQPTRVTAVVEGSTLPIDKIFFEHPSKDPSLTIDAEKMPTQIGSDTYRSTANVTSDKAGIHGIVMRTEAVGMAASLWNSIDVLKHIELSVHPRILFLSPGQEKEFLVQLKNNSSFVKQATIGLKAEGEIGLEYLPSRSIASMEKGDLIKYALPLRTKENSPSRDCRLNAFASSGEEVIDETPVFLRITSPDHVRALVIWGGGSEVGGWDKPLDSFMASQNKVAVDLIQSYSLDSPGFNIETLKQNYDVAMIAWLHKGAASFTIGQLKALSDYVANGGGFVMGGGWRTYQGLNEDDQGNFHGTPLEETLPVVISDTYDARNIPAEIECLKPENPVMKGIDWRTCPRLRGYNQIAGTKSNAEILAVDRKTGNPLIVIWEYKKGRSMSFLSDFSGGWGQLFGNWRYYNTFLTNMMLWLAKKI